MFAPKMIMIGSGQGGVQEITINGGSNFVLSSDAGFLTLSKSKPIIVTLTGTFTATNSSNYAFQTGNLSTWDEVQIFNTGTIRARGGAGGAGSNGSASNAAGGAGGAGGSALLVTAATAQQS